MTKTKKALLSRIQIINDDEILLKRKLKKKYFSKKKTSKANENFKSQKKKLLQKQRKKNDDDHDFNQETVFIENDILNVVMVRISLKILFYWNYF